MAHTAGIAAAAAGFFAFALALPLAVVLTSSAPEAAAAELNRARVPAQWAPLIVAAGARCPGRGVDAPLLAAQLEAESGWDPTATSPVGASGLAQFMPGTWELWGRDVDGDGISSPLDPADAIDAQARFMCHLGEWVDQKRRLGVISGDPLVLTLAAYNAGAGAVASSAGVPPYPETQGYITRIRELLPAYTFDSGLVPGLGRGSGAGIVAAAAKWVGHPYVWGGGDLAGPTGGGFDCSGLVRHALWQATGIDLGRPADAQARDPRGIDIPRDLAVMRPGDVIGFSDTAGANYQHIGIYAGNGQLVEAPRTGKAVQITDLRTDTYFAPMVWSIKRYTAEAATVLLPGPAGRPSGEAKTPGGAETGQAKTGRGRAGGEQDDKPDQKRRSERPAGDGEPGGGQQQAQTGKPGR